MARVRFKIGNALKSLPTNVDINVVEHKNGTQETVSKTITYENGTKEIVNKTGIYKITKDDEPLIHLDFVKKIP